MKIACPMIRGNDINRDFDVCIVGAGPAGLATLSALHSPYSLDSGTMSNTQQERALITLSRQQRRQAPMKRFCVIDRNKTWMEEWQSNFDRLSIENLRSPALAHPDLFDPHALLSFAIRQGRESELLESGCGDIKKLFGLGQSQIGLWTLPSTKLFVDFCLELTKELPHNFIGESVVKNLEKVSNSRFRLVLSNGTFIQAKAVVLAVGMSGRPIVPFGIQNCPYVRHWTQLSPSTTLQVDSRKEFSELPVMVVGGGLTAVQVTLNELNRLRSSSKGQDYRVILVSKRPLVEKHFDIDIQWFDQRKTNKCVADFYHHPMNARVQALKEARRGGSVPPLYMKHIRQAEEDGSLLCLVGDVESLTGGRSDFETTSVRVCHRELKRRSHGGQKLDAPPTTVASEFQVKEIIVACGVQPDCEKPSSLSEMIQAKFPIQVEKGLPCVTQDLRWKEGMDLFVVGSFAALNVGPDAGNLMGIRRAAQIVANALGSRTWLRESVLVNPFEALAALDETDSDSASDESSHDGKS
jgi:hypothetical protein